MATTSRFVELCWQPFGKIGDSLNQELWRGDPVTIPSRNRRDFFRFSSSLLAGGMVPYYFHGQQACGQTPTDRPLIAAIGVGGQGTGIARQAARFGDVVAVCDVDRNHAERAQADENLGKGKAETYVDYREVLDRKDVEAVTIGTPDHWHTKISIDAMRAGKDVYCEKPLSLTIDEGKKLCQVAKETGRVFQVGTQQRSQTDQFLKAIAMVRDGRIGNIKRITVAIGGCGGGGPFQPSEVPAHFDYQRWLGQAPQADYFPQRCHFNFRWFYDYSGGQITDWGVHHVDIAQWAMGMEHSGPVSIRGTGRFPRQEANAYEVAMQFRVECQFAGGMELIMRHDTDNGILLEGDAGRIFVNRGKLTGKPVEMLADNPLPEDAIKNVYKGKQPGDHMRNFFECIQDREDPISDIYSQHRAVSTCHLANISLRLGLKHDAIVERHDNDEFTIQGRELAWDAEQEQVIDDEEANAMQKRAPRAGYEI